MHVLQPDFFTAYGMNALCAFSMACGMWVLRRTYDHPGLPWALASATTQGGAYVLLALHGQLLHTNWLLAASVLSSSSLACLTLAMLRFRQHRQAWRPYAALLPPWGLLLLALVLGPQTPLVLQQQHMLVTGLQALYFLGLLLRLRPRLPGHGWRLLTTATLLQITLLLPPLQPPLTLADLPELGTSMTSMLFMWLLCLLLFLDIVGSYGGFLVMLRDRQSAAERSKTLLDSLTQLPNRAALVAQLEEAIHEAIRLQQPVAIMVLDIDHFKQVNDNHGHLVGDQVIQWLVRVLRQHIRSTDFAGRYGGEEFVLVLPTTATRQAVLRAETLCQAVRQSPLTLADGRVLPLSISIGVYAGIPPPGCRWQELIELADQAMYVAKHQGRDQVSLALVPALPEAG